MPSIRPRGGRSATRHRPKRAAKPRPQRAAGTALFGEGLQPVLIGEEYFERFGDGPDVFGVFRFIGRQFGCQVDDGTNSGVQNGGQNRVHFSSIAPPRMGAGQELAGNYPV